MGGQSVGESRHSQPRSCASGRVWVEQWATFITAITHSSVRCSCSLQPQSLAAAAAMSQPPTNNTAAAQKFTAPGGTKYTLLR
jgi:hypothetical protein